MKLALLLMLAAGDGGFASTTTSFSQPLYSETPIEQVSVSCAGQNATLDAGVLTCGIHIACANGAEPSLEKRGFRMFAVCDNRKDGGR